MSNRSKLLIVISIAMILLGAVALTTDLIDLSNAPQSFRIVSSIAASVVCIISGFYGIFCKSRKTILMMGILLLFITTIDVVVGVGFFDMGLFHFTLLVWPCLYLWGWYRSKRNN